MKNKMFRDLLIEIRKIIDDVLEQDKAERNKSIEAETVGEEEKSCMTPQDCEECPEPCNICGHTYETDPSSIDIIISGIKPIPKTPDYFDILDNLTVLANRGHEKAMDAITKVAEEVSIEVEDFETWEKVLVEIKKKLSPKIPKAPDLEEGLPEIPINIPMPKVKQPKPSKETLDGVRRSELTNKYSRRCTVCKLIAVHDHSTSGVCPDCAADIRTRMEESNRKMEESHKKFDQIIETEKGN